MSELEQVKAIIGIVDDGEDTLLQLLLDRAEEIIKLLSRTPDEYKYLIVDAVVIAYNQRGAEGNTFTRSGDFSQNWSYDTMHDFIKSKLPARYVIK